MNKVISNRKLLSMVLLGSLLETYDYALYGYFAPFFANQFFPNLNHVASMLMTFGVFAAGFLARPIGAAILGNYGDKHGRKKTLMLSIILMAVSTMLMGALPTYAHIGMLSGILLMLCRLLQGFAVGAEFVGTMIYMIEYAPPNRKSLYGSLCVCSGYCSVLLTSILILLFNRFISVTTLHAWAWRIPFLMSIVLGFVGVMIRSQLPETPAFKALQMQTKKSPLGFSPLFQVIFKMPLAVLQGIGVVTMHILGFYLLFVYLSSYLLEYYKIPINTSAMINSIALIVSMGLIPVVGWLGEKFQKKHLIALSCFGFILFSYPLFCLLNEASLTSIIIAQMIFSILLCFSCAMTPGYLSDLFPPALRYTGMGLAYNVSAVLFGGLTPLLLTYLSDKTKNVAAPGYCLMIAGCITLISVFLIKQKAASPLERIALEEMA